MSKHSTTSPAREDFGTTLVEVLVVSIVTLVILTMAYHILQTTTQTTRTTTNRAANAADARQAVDFLESSLRNASAVNLCGSGSTATSCSAPASPTTSSAIQVITVNGSNPQAVGCTESLWSLTGAGLARAVAARGVSGALGLIVPSVAAGTDLHNGPTSGFTLPLSNQRLVQIDLTVNADSHASYKAADSVTVHDLVAPNNAGTYAATTTGASCS